MASRTEITVILRKMVGFLVDDPETIKIQEEEEPDGVLYRILCAPNDMGKIVGRQGRIARSLRVLLRSAGATAKIKVSLDVTDRFGKPISDPSLTMQPRSPIHRLWRTSHPSRRA